MTDGVIDNITKLKKALLKSLPEAENNRKFTNRKEQAQELLKDIKKYSRDLQWFKNEDDFWEQYLAALENESKEEEKDLTKTGEKKLLEYYTNTDTMPRAKNAPSTYAGVLKDLLAKPLSELEQVKNELNVPSFGSKNRTFAKAQNALDDNFAREVQEICKKLKKKFNTMSIAQNFVEAFDNAKDRNDFFEAIINTKLYYTVNWLGQADKNDKPSLQAKIKIVQKQIESWEEKEKAEALVRDAKAQIEIEIELERKIKKIVQSGEISDIEEIKDGINGINKLNDPTLNGENKGIPRGVGPQKDDAKPGDRLLNGKKKYTAAKAEEHLDSDLEREYNKMANSRDIEGDIKEREYGIGKKKNDVQTDDRLLNGENKGIQGDVLPGDDALSNISVADSVSEFSNHGGMSKSSINDDDDIPIDIDAQEEKKKKENAEEKTKLITEINKLFVANEQNQILSLFKTNQAQFPKKINEITKLLSSGKLQGSDGLIERLKAICVKTSVYYSRSRDHATLSEVKKLSSALSDLIIVKVKNNSASIQDLSQKLEKVEECLSIPLQLEDGEKIKVWYKEDEEYKFAELDTDSLIECVNWVKDERAKLTSSRNNTTLASKIVNHEKYIDEDESFRIVHKLLLSNNDSAYGNLETLVDAISKNKTNTRNKTEDKNKENRNNLIKSIKNFGSPKGGLITKLEQLRKDKEWAWECTRMQSILDKVSNEDTTFDDFKDEGSANSLQDLHRNIKELIDIVISKDKTEFHAKLTAIENKLNLPHATEDNKKIRYKDYECTVKQLLPLEQMYIPYVPLESEQRLFESEQTLFDTLRNECGEDITKAMIEAAVAAKTREGEEIDATSKNIKGFVNQKGGLTKKLSQLGKNKEWAWECTRMQSILNKVSNEQTTVGKFGDDDDAKSVKELRDSIKDLIGINISKDKKAFHNKLTAIENKLNLPHATEDNKNIKYKDCEETVEGLLKNKKASLNYLIENWKCEQEVAKAILKAAEAAKTREGEAIGAMSKNIKASVYKPQGLVNKLVSQLPYTKATGGLIKKLEKLGNGNEWERGRMQSIIDKLEKIGSSSNEKTTFSKFGDDDDAKSVKELRDSIKDLIGINISKGTDAKTTFREKLTAIENKLNLPHATEDNRYINYGKNKHKVYNLLRNKATSLEDLQDDYDYKEEVAEAIIEAAEAADKRNTANFEQNNKSAKLNNNKKNFNSFTKTNKIFQSIGNKNKIYCNSNDLATLERLQKHLQKFQAGILQSTETQQEKFVNLFYKDNEVHYKGMEDFIEQLARYNQNPQKYKDTLRNLALLSKESEATEQYKSKINQLDAKVNQLEKLKDRVYFGDGQSIAEIRDRIKHYKRSPTQENEKLIDQALDIARKQLSRQELSAPSNPSEEKTLRMLDTLCDRKDYHLSIDKNTINNGGYAKKKIEEALLYAITESDPNHQLDGNLIKQILNFTSQYCDDICEKNLPALKEQWQKLYPRDKEEQEEQEKELTCIVALAQHFYSYATRESIAFYNATDKKEVTMQLLHIPPGNQQMIDNVMDRHQNQGTNQRSFTI